MKFKIFKVEFRTSAFRFLGKWVLFGFIITSMNIAFRYIELDSRISGIVEKTLVFLLIIAITGILAKIIRNLITSYQEKNRDVLQPASLFSNLITVIIYVLGILIALDSIGISITPIIATLGVGGLAVALALQDTLSNLFAGIYISVSRVVRVGDYIKLNTGEEGYVVDITWRNTIMISSNNYIIIPNSKLAQAIITNYSLPNKQILAIINFQISYDNDLEKVESITLEVARQVLNEVEGTIRSFEPIVRYANFSDLAITVSVVFEIREFQYRGLVVHEFLKRLQKRYKEEGIEMSTKALKFS